MIQRCAAAYEAFRPVWLVVRGQRGPATVCQLAGAIRPLGSSCTVIPVLTYPDPVAVPDWLSQAFGFTVRLRISNPRIRMKANDGCFKFADGTVAQNNAHLSCNSGSRMPRGPCERARQAVAITPGRAARPTSTASANTTLRTFAALAEIHDLPRTSLRRNGAAVRFILSESILVRPERCRTT